jgi:hypothetical protein
MHDAVFDAQSLEPAATLFVLVGAVGIDRLLIAQNQVVGDLALVDLGWRKPRTPLGNARLFADALAARLRREQL